MIIEKFISDLKEQCGWEGFAVFVDISIDRDLDIHMTVILCHMNNEDLEWQTNLCFAWEHRSERLEMTLLEAVTQAKQLNEV